MFKKIRITMLSSTLAVGLITIGAQTASAIRF